MRLALLSCVTPERVREVEGVLYNLAIGGDVAAIRTWLDHVAGKAPQALELSGKVETPTARVIIVEDNGRPTRPPLGMQAEEEHVP
jgi:hypothetical protein